MGFKNLNGLAGILGNTSGEWFVGIFGFYLHKHMH